MNTICTRLATVADVDAIAPMFDAYRQFYQQTPALDVAKRFLRERLQSNESMVLLALDAAKKTIGFCQLYPTFCSVEAKPIYTLYDLFVTPHARRTGAAKALLQAAERLSLDNGKVRMDLTTAKTNQAAQSLYASLGWVRDEVFHAYSKSIQP